MGDSRHDRTIEDPLIDLLRNERCRARIGMESVASYIGVSLPAVYGWENGTARPNSLLRWMRWAKAIDAKLEIKVTTKAGEEFIFSEDRA
ncbi:hypothetical protein LCGC14_2176630 [marine sediment metagenome]|uniref:HTH cro/C1-type domain-containing protein n=1 Tax=marine sediment metagenome TaxID=412755 RepID=A0A0F9GJD0_9ZZZZ